MTSLGASTAFAAEILGNHLSLSLARSVQSSSTPAALKPMAIFSKKKASPTKAKPVAVTPASEELAKWYGPDRRIFLPNGLLDRDDIPEYLDGDDGLLDRDDIPEYLDGDVPDDYGYNPLGLEKKPVNLAKYRGSAVCFIIHEALNEFEAISGSEVVWSKSWILDSGATYHMCLNRKWFDTFEETDNEVALTGDHTVSKVAGVGTVKVKMFDGIVRTLGDVRYIPSLRTNIISLGTLDRLGYGFEGSRGELKVTKGSIVYMKGDKMSNNIYRLQGVTMVGGAAVSTQEDSEDTTDTTRKVDRKSTDFLKKRSKNVRQYRF